VKIIERCESNLVLIHFARKTTRVSDISTHLEFAQSYKKLQISCEPDALFVRRW
jgi:hypothetical protein